MVWLRAGQDVDILVNDLRTQVYHPEAFEQMGIELAKKSIGDGQITVALLRTVPKDRFTDHSGGNTGGNLA